MPPVSPLTVWQVLRMHVCDLAILKIARIYPRCWQRSSLFEALCVHFKKVVAYNTGGASAQVSMHPPMAYIATDRASGDTYAICLADPAYIIDVATNVTEWLHDDAVVELLPIEEAWLRFSSSAAGTKE